MRGNPWNPAGGLFSDQIARAPPWLGRPIEGLVPMLSTDGKGVKRRAGYLGPSRGSEAPARGRADEALLEHPKRRARAHSVDGPQRGIELPRLVLRVVGSREALQPFRVRDLPGH